jgi:succinate dehydrogenase / fumarate reductase, cytochrome b subunit
MAESATRPKRYAPWYNLSLGNLPLPGLVSIFHRVSGAVLFFMLWFLLWLFQASLASEDGFERVRELSANILVKLVLLGLLWSYLHHFCAGIRYLFLDMHKGIDLPSARRTSAAVFVASILLTIGIAATLLW